LRNIPHGDRFRGNRGFADWASAGSAVIARQARNPANLEITPLHKWPPCRRFSLLYRTWGPLFDD
jgi:hypothetical protein